MMHAVPRVDIPAAEQASLKHSRVPELSPSDPISNTSSPSSSEPVTPVDPPSLAAHPDPLVAGKHQPDPQPYRPIVKTASRGAVWRARQVLFSLGKRKRQPSEEAEIPAGVDVQVLDSEEEEAIDSPAETAPPASQSLFTLPNIPIDGMATTRVRSRLVRSLVIRRNTYDALPSAPAIPALPVGPAQSATQPPPGSPWTPPALSATRVIFFLPWCIAVGAAIVLFPRALTRLVRLYAAPPRTPLRRLAYHAQTAREHVGIFVGAVCLAAAALPGWPLRFALLGAVAIRAVVVARGIEAQIERRGKVEGSGEEWREDARCVWRVLCGEEEREIQRVCTGGGTVKED